MDNEMYVNNPWFEFIKSGIKIIEGRLNKGRFAKYKIGDKIKLINPKTKESFYALIVDIMKYKTFERYLSFEGLKRTLPGIKTIDEGVGVYRQFYNEEDEIKYCVLALRLKLV